MVNCGDVARQTKKGFGLDAVNVGTMTRKYMGEINGK